jgi:tungstate transport system permease protein
MDFLVDGLNEAARLIASGDEQVLDATGRTLSISLSAVFLAVLLGLPIAACLARRRFFGHRLLLAGFRSLLGVPTVFLGLICFGLFARRGPLGPLDLLYTPTAIVFGETLLALPIIVALTHGALTALDPRVSETSRTLGAGRLRRLLTDFSEARTGLILAVLTAFARCSTELGIAMMVGGNLKDRTRTLATATALEAGKGEFAVGLAMGGLLLLLATGMTLLVALVGREKRTDR